MKKKRTDYNAFVSIGIAFIGAGIASISTTNRGVGLGLLTLGIVYLIIGVAKMGKSNRKKP